MSDCELDEKISELQVSSDPPKRGRGRPKKEKPPKEPKVRIKLTEEERLSRKRQCNAQYGYRRKKVAEFLLVMLRNGKLAPVDRESKTALVEFAKSHDIDIPFS